MEPQSSLNANLRAYCLAAIPSRSVSPDGALTATAPSFGCAESFVIQFPTIKPSRSGAKAATEETFRRRDDFHE